MNDQAEPDSDTKRRRWRQFGLRGLLSLVLLIAVGLFACRVYLKPYWRQQQTVALVEKLGGSCQTTEVSQWWLRLAGSTQNVSQINLADCDDPDAYVAEVAELPAIELLIVGGRAFTDEHARRLHRLHTLRGLILDSTSVSDDGVAALRQAQSDTEVYVSQRRAVTALKTVGHIELQPNLARSPLQHLAGPEWFEEAAAFLAERVVIDKRVYAVERPENRFRDGNCSHLKALRQLEHLTFCDTPVTDAGLNNVERLSRLKTLDLRGTQVTDQGLDRIKTLAQLQVLWLDNTTITDAGLVHLKVLAHLQRLVLNESNVTAAGIADLKQALPNCQIEGP